MGVKKKEAAKKRSVAETAEGIPSATTISNSDEVAEPKKEKQTKAWSGKSSSKKRPALLFDEKSNGNIIDDVSDKEGGGKPHDRAVARALKKQRKEDLLSKIPKVDPATSIPYNKIQIRRMLRRVKHGLDPIPTEEEERIIWERAKRDKIEVDRLLFAEEDEERNVDIDDVHEDKQDDAGDKANDNQGPEEEGGGYEISSTDKAAHDTSKKTKRSKPVPPDYICQACQNNLPNFTTPHWIYDCPNKVTQRGCNAVAKKLRGLHDPPSRKVFVSGLPFECTERQVKRYFEKNIAGDRDDNDVTESLELVHCKLLKFEDSNRCKGQAFLTFESDLGAKMALKLNGSVWEDVDEVEIVKKKKRNKTASAKDESGGGNDSKKKELKLKVTKVLNRHVTKNKFSK